MNNFGPCLGRRISTTFFTANRTTNLRKCQVRKHSSTSLAPPTASYESLRFQQANHSSIFFNTKYMPRTATTGPSATLRKKTNTATSKDGALFVPPINKTLWTKDAKNPSDKNNANQPKHNRHNHRIPFNKPLIPWDDDGV
jgi:hypothetical protein